MFMKFKYTIYVLVTPSPQNPGADPENLKGGSSGNILTSYQVHRPTLHHFRKKTIPLKLHPWNPSNPLCLPTIEVTIHAGFESSCG